MEPTEGCLLAGSKEPDPRESHSEDSTGALPGTEALMWPETLELPLFFKASSQLRNTFPPRLALLSLVPLVSCLNSSYDSFSRLPVNNLLTAKSTWTFDRY